MKEIIYNSYHETPEYEDFPEEAHAQSGLVEELPDITQSLEEQQLSDLTDYILLASEEIGKLVDQGVPADQLEEELQRWVVAAPTKAEARFMIDTGIGENWISSNNMGKLLHAWEERKNIETHIVVDEKPQPDVPRPELKKPVFEPATHAHAGTTPEEWRQIATELVLESTGWDLIRIKLDVLTQMANAPDAKTAKIMLAQAVADKKLDGRDHVIVSFFAGDPRTEIAAYRDTLEQRSAQFWRDVETTEDTDQFFLNYVSAESTSADLLFSLQETHDILGQIAQKRSQLVIANILKTHQAGQGLLARRLQQQAEQRTRERSEEQEERLKAIRATRWQRRKGGRRSSSEPTTSDTAQKKTIASGNFLAYAQEAEEHKKFLDGLLDNASELDTYRGRLRGANLEEFDYALEEHRRERAWEQQENTRFSELTRLHYQALEQWENFQEEMADLVAMSDPDAEPFSHTGYPAIGLEESITRIIELAVDPFSFAPLRSDMLTLINLHGEIARLELPQVKQQQEETGHKAEDADTTKPAAAAEQNTHLRVSVQNRFVKPKKAQTASTRAGLEALQIHVHPIALDHLIKNVHTYLKEVRLTKPQRDDLSHTLHRLAWWKKHGGVDQLTYRSIFQEPGIEAMQVWRRRKTMPGQTRSRRLSTKS